MNTQEHILIVDDNPDNLQILGKLLNSNGYKVTIAKSGIEALNYTSTHIPDLILLDVMMPGLDGFEVCQRIKSEPKTDKIPIIFLTALTETEHIIRGFDLGGEDYIKKPFKQQEVISRVNAIIMRKRLENDLKRARDQYESLFRNSQVPIVILGDNFEVNYWNNAFENLLQLFEGDIKGKLYKSFFDENEHGKLDDYFKQLYDGQQSSPIETCITDGKDRTIWLLLDSKIITYQDDSCLQVVMTNITKMKELDEMKSAFISTASHELRTPLTSILGYLETLLKYEDIDSATQKDFLQTIYQESQRLKMIMSDLLNFARLETGEMKYSKEKSDICNLLEIAVNRLKDGAAERDIQIKYEHDNTNSIAVVDEGKILQVFDNIVANAIKYSNEGGRINIKVENSGESIKISVSDNGIGISKNSLPYIFNRFHRDKTNASRIPGTGLGLAYAKEVIEAHNGKIEVMSVLKEGSTFTIYIPQ